MKTNSITYKLTVLWALNESVLGGFLHAIKMPFTGLVVGGIAIAIISLINYYDSNPFSATWKSAASVMLVKLLISPFTPFTAYVAVLFQCFAGAVLFLLFDYKRWVVVLFAILSMVESAIQKVLVLTLIFGKALWDSINQFMASVLTQFGMQSTSFSRIVIWTYIGIYFFWGIIIGIFIYRLPAAIDQCSNNIKDILMVESSTAIQTKPKTPTIKIITRIFFVLIIMGFIYFFNPSILLIIKSVFIIITLYFILPFLINWFIKKFKKADNHTTRLIADTTALKADAMLVWKYVNRTFKGVVVYYQFIIHLFAISVFDKNE